MTNKKGKTQKAAVVKLVAQPPPRTSAPAQRLVNAVYRETGDERKAMRNIVRQHQRPGSVQALVESLALPGEQGVEAVRLGDPVSSIRTALASSYNRIIPDISQWTDVLQSLLWSSCYAI